MVNTADSSLGAPPLRVEEVRTTEALDALRPEWSALWWRCPEATPFQTPEWLIPWRWHFAAPHRLRTLAFRRDGRLVGLAPFFVHHWEGRWQVSLLGTGISDILDVLAETELRKAVARATLAYLASHRDGWDLCDLEQLPPDSPLLTATVPAELRAEVTDQDVRLVIPLADTAAAYVAGLTKRKRQHLRTEGHRLARAGEFRYETADETTLPEFLDALERLHTARWEKQGEAGALSTATLRSFYREAAGELLRSGLLRPHALRLNQRIIAAVYAFADRSRSYNYLTGFDPEHGYVSPGTLLLRHAIERAIREGHREFDCLRGTEPYKYTWGARERWNRRLRLWPRDAAGNGTRNGEIR